MVNNTAGQVITCKAAVAWGPEQPLVMEEILVDPPQKMEVRIKVLFTSICHTDLSAWKGENESQRAYPRIFGHEASGIVESVGEGVTDLKEGDHVIPIFNGECGECEYCRCERTNMCRDYGVNPMKKAMVADGRCRFRTKETGEPIFHFLNTSTFSEFTVVESACAVKVDPCFPLEKMAMLSCGVSSGVGAAWNTADVKAGSTVAIFGLGSVGLAVRIHHASPDPDPFRALDFIIVFVPSTFIYTRKELARTTSLRASSSLARTPLRSHEKLIRNKRQRRRLGREKIPRGCACKSLFFHFADFDLV